MFSRLDSLFRTALRQTEATDTWLGIRRDEEKEKRRNSRQKEKGNDETFWEDQTEISLPGLIAVLESLINEPAAPPAATAGGEGNGGDGAGQPLPGKAALAASAYQETARRTTGRPAPVAPPESAHPEIQLTPGETRAITELIEDLRRLEGSGVTLLRLPQGNSFLHSLQLAVRQAAGD